MTTIAATVNGARPVEAIGLGAHEPAARDRGQGLSRGQTTAVAMSIALGVVVAGYGLAGSYLSISELADRHHVPVRTPSSKVAASVGCEPGWKRSAASSPPDHGPPADSPSTPNSRYQDQCRDRCHDSGCGRRRSGSGPSGSAPLFESSDEIELVGEAADGHAAVVVVRQTVPDIVLMDIRMPIRDGRAALVDITSDPMLADVRVIMLTTFEHDEYIFDSLRNGASGFLLKDDEPTELLHAVQVVADGGSLLSPSVTRRVIEQFATRPSTTTVPHPDLARLTEREREIVAWVASGRSNDEIAAELVVSPATVRTHVGRAMTKLNARDRAQLVVFAVRSGLTIPD